MEEGFGSRRGAAEFWQIRNGYLAKRVQEGTPESYPVTKKDGSVYYEIRQDYFVGRLKKVEVRAHEEYGDFLKLTLVAKGTNYSIEMDLNSGYAFGFLSTIPNADLEHIIQLTPSYTEKDGKKTSKIFLQQESGWLKQYFTKENPNGLPELKKIKIKGKDTWDNSDRMDWFKEVLIPKLSAKLREIWSEETEEVEDEIGENKPITTKLPF